MHVYDLEVRMIRFILGIIIGIVSLIFIVQNTETVQITFIAWKLMLPRAIMFLALVFFGFIMGWIFRSVGVRKKRIKERENKEKE